MAISRKTEELLRRRFELGEAVTRTILIGAALITLAITLGIAFFFVNESLLFFRDPGFSVGEFFGTTAWQPAAGAFGALPLLNATLVTVGIGLLFAAPTGLAAAVYLTEYASPRVRSFFTPALEVLSSIPTVVYGYFALYQVTPLLRRIFGADVVEVYNTFSAGIVLGVLILPVIISLTVEALSSVPSYAKEAPIGIGATGMEAFFKVSLPAAGSGILSALVVAMSRAAGESVIVSLAAGSGPNFTFNPFRAAETMTGYILRIARGEFSYGTVDYTSIFAMGLVLFGITFGLNAVSWGISARSRRRYE